jgi:multidrug efflux system outer membrane protein
MALAVALSTQPPALAAQPQPALTLGGAVREGLAQDPRLRQAELELQRTLVGLEGARAEQLQYGADLAVGNWTGVTGLLSTAPVQPMSVPIANAQVMARWPLFTGYRLDRQIDAAEAGALSARARLDQARQATIYEVLEAYWSTRRAELKAAVQQEAVRRAREAWEIARAIAREGQGGAREAERAEVAALMAEGEALRLEAEAARARDRLATLLRRDLTGVALSDGVGSALPSPPDPIGPAALEQRPDVRLARAEVALRAAGVGVAAADRWPQVEVASMYQHGNNPFFATSQNRSVLDRLVGTWNAQVSLSYHLFDHGVIARNIQSRTLEQGVAEQTLTATLATAEAELRAARRRVALAERRVALGQRNEALARRNLDWLQGRFRAGLARLTELNEARVSLVEGRNQRLDAEIDRALARAALHRALGTLEAPNPRPQEGTR